MSDDQKKQLQATLQELSKASSLGAKVISNGENVLQNASNIKEVELLDMNMTKLREIAEHAEEVQTRVVGFTICWGLFGKIGA